MFKPTVISDNHITQYSEACIRLYDGPAVIQRNHLESKPDMNGYPFFGLEIDGCSPLIQNNTITNTGVAICLRDSGAKMAKSTIQYNNVFNNRDANIFLGYPARPGYNPADYSAVSSIDAVNNWWGTTDNQAISQAIHDSKNQADLGTVNFVPFLTAPNAQAMPNPNAPTPTLEQVSTAQFLQATNYEQHVELIFYGDSKIDQHSQINITANLLAATTNVTFVVSGDEGNSDFFNMTIPKSAVPYGVTPTVYKTGEGDLSTQDQGYNQDADNYYVWCTTHFDGPFYGGLTIEFANSQQSLILNPLVITGILATIIVTAALTIFVFTKKKKKTSPPI